MAAAESFRGGLGGLGAGSGVGVGLGAGVRAGLDPAALLAMAHRLAGISQEMQALRLQLGQVALLDWKSPAATAFREELSARDAAMLAVVRAIDSAANAVSAYGFAAGSSPDVCLNPDLPGQRAPWFAGGLGPGFGPGFSGAGAGSAGAGIAGFAPGYGTGNAGGGWAFIPSSGG
ncbi:hypothetical protein AS189_02125 [Arthrobacter alpinus]|uniref:Uncharacterized protein n=1 Tax=Arthrobacter alpinus TaxID=656366 RepID=A0A0S2LVI3_9MICC|nr:hypothetical protein [Arthrobacter alpinus]ALO65508.1 hypothetical protein AS189_02125 [Arthrobacter alpinus]